MPHGLTLDRITEVMMKAHQSHKKNELQNNHCQTQKQKARGKKRWL